MATVAVVVAALVTGMAGTPSALAHDPAEGAPADGAPAEEPGSAPPASTTTTTTAPGADVRIVRPIVFPVDGPVTFRNDFGDCRGAGCSRRHAGNDLMGRKMQPLRAATDGTVVWLRHGADGNLLALEDDDGWRYWYIHLNNDTPGTDDGANRYEDAFAPGIRVGARVRAGQPIGYMGDSGNAEGTAPHLHFEIRRPDGTPVNPYWSLQLSRGAVVDGWCGPDTRSNEPEPSSGGGYWMMGTDGGIFSFGRARFHGSMGGRPLNAPIVGMAPTPSGAGYWLVASDGGIFAFGDARFHGSMGGRPLNAPIVGMAPTPSGAGYWLVASDGGIFAFGDARFHGSTGDLRLVRPITAMAVTPTGRGYWLLASDGGLFAFGDARFHGSLPGLGLRPEEVTATGMVSTPTGDGYWILVADGRVFRFGDAEPHGDLWGAGLCGPLRATRIRATATGQGYWVSTADGKVVGFGDAAHFGDMGGRPLNAPTIDLAPLPPSGGTGG